MKRNMIIMSTIGLLLLGGAVALKASADSVKGSARHAMHDGRQLIVSQQAEEIALGEVKGSVKSVELEKDDGRLEYEVEIKAQDGHDDVDVKIDAESGKVIQVDWDDIDDDWDDVDDDWDDDAGRYDDDRSVYNQSSHDADVKQHKKEHKAHKQRHQVKISKKQAMDIALQDTPGKVTDVDVEKHYYEIEIRNGRTEVEYKIDKYTGIILEKDVDDDDDD